MATIVRELPGNPSYVLDSLAGRLTSDGWEVTTRSGPLLQAVRNGRFLSLTVLGSARGTRVHAEGSLDAIHYIRRAMGPKSAPPKEFSLNRGRPNFGTAAAAGLGLTVVASLLLLAAFCQSSSSSDVRSSAIANSALPSDGIGRQFGEGVGQSVLPSATPALRQPTPTSPGAAAAQLRRQPTLPPALPSATPEPPAPTPTEIPPSRTPDAPTVASAAMTPTPTVASLRPSAEPSQPTPEPPPGSPSPTPTIDLSRLGDAYRR